jgi:hypothetical protein
MFAAMLPLADPLNGEALVLFLLHGLAFALAAPVLASLPAEAL